jgi:hypothetical protein
MQEMTRSMVGPAWRSKQAERLARKDGPLPRAESDDLTRRTAEYLRVCRSGPDGESRAAEKYPDVAAAIRLWNNVAMAEQLRILVLANISIKEIAARLQIDEHIIMIAEQLFFDVRWALHASGWVVCQVIIPEIQAGAFDMAAKLRVAFFGGPVMARAILDARVRLPDNDADRLFDREVLLQLKLQEALEAPLGDGERTEFLKLVLQYDINRRRLELDRKKFAYECEHAEHQGKSEDEPKEAAADEPPDEDSKPEWDWQWDDDEHRVVTKSLLKRIVA